MSNGTDGRDLRDRPLGEVAGELTRDLSLLVRQEMELAKAEMTIKAKRLGIGAGAFGGAALVAVFALGALTATIILALATAVAPWVAALIVTAIYAAIAGVLALAGRKEVELGTPPVPERAIDTTKEDLEHIKQRAKEDRN